MSVTGDEWQVHVDPFVKRVLVFRLGSLGDTVVALPSLHLIARAFPNAERRMLTNVPVDARAPAAAAVLGGSGLIHSYERYPVGTRSPARLLALLWRLVRFRPEVAIYLKEDTAPRTVRRDALFLRCTGARRLVGLPLSEDAAGRMEADGSYEPEAQRLLRYLVELGRMPLDAPAAWNLRLTDAERQKAGEVLALLQSEPYFAVSVGTKVQAKNWGVDNWRSLLQSLARQYPGHGLLLAGAPDERAASEGVAEAWRAVEGAGAVVNVCGKLSPRESAAAFTGARAFLGHDSGPMHLAAAVGTPVVALFSARNKPRTWFPVCPASRVLYHRVDCWGCGLDVCRSQRRKCLLSITVPEVLQALESLLQEDMLRRNVPPADDAA